MGTSRRKRFDCNTQAWMSDLVVTVLPDLPRLGDNEETEMAKVALFFGDQVVQVSPLMGLVDILRTGDLAPIEKAILTLDAAGDSSVGSPLLGHLSGVLSFVLDKDIERIAAEFAVVAPNERDSHMYAGLWMHIRWVANRKIDNAADVALPSPIEVARLADVVEALVSEWDGKGLVDQVLFSLPFHELASAESAGEITIVRPEISSDWPRTLSLVAGLGGAVLKHGLDSSSWPFLSASTAHLARSFAEIGNHEAETERSAVAVDLARHVLGRLPRFQAASLREVAGMRKELAEPLMLFRSEMTELAGVSATRLGHPGYQSDLRTVYEKRVIPALNELDALISAKGWGETLGKEARSAAAMTVAVAAVTFPSPLLVGLFGLVVGSGTRAERRRQQQAIYHHGLGLVYHLR